jgi:hypothetical protein
MKHDKLNASEIQKKGWPTFVDTIPFPKKEIGKKKKIIGFKQV